MFEKKNLIQYIKTVLRIINQLQKEKKKTRKKNIEGLSSLVFSGDQAGSESSTAHRDCPSGGSGTRWFRNATFNRKLSKQRLNRDFFNRAQQPLGRRWLQQTTESEQRSGGGTGFTTQNDLKRQVMEGSLGTVKADEKETKTKHLA